ncbi:MAG: hypothetical protein FWC97_03775 [Treponema sp.]|nr:hypothetical protein [Treponema sp.]
MTHKPISDPVAYLQAHYARMFMERHNLQPHEFVALNKKKDILGFLRLGYEPFHLTGSEGVLEELNKYVFEDSIS